MATAVATCVKRNTVIAGAIAFLAQVLLAISVEVGDDVGRSLFSQHGTELGIRNARNVVDFEVAHGFFVEPAWQEFFEQTHQFLVFSIGWTQTVHIMNGIYILCHIFVTLGVAFWLYFYRRPIFGLVRNTVIFTNVIALVVYENFPVAPPRLTPDLLFNHHHFVFQDTVFGIASAGNRLVAPSVGYNEFSAMPSVHMAWAYIVTGCLLLLARPVWIKVLAAFYPGLMLIAIVVTGNHYLLDAAGSLPIVVAALLVALAFERVKHLVVWPFRPANRSQDSSHT